MPPLILSALVLGAACAAGLNCYLTVFLAGLAGKLGWLPGEAGAVFSQPAVLWVAGALFLLEAVVDKIPGVDSLWDLLHTVIRPAGAVLLAAQFLAGEADWQVPGAILAGVAALSVHLTRAAVRLRINNQPGPAGNVIAGITGDALAAGIFLLAVHQPLAGLWVCGVLTGMTWLLFPRTFRLVRATGSLLWTKLRIPAGNPEPPPLPDGIAAHLDILVHAAVPDAGAVEWAVPCVTGAVRRFAGISGNQRGMLIRLRAHPDTLVFVGRRWFRDRAAVVASAGCEVQQESRFLSEDLVIFSRPEKRRVGFRFSRGEAARVRCLVESLRGRAVTAAAAVTEPVAEPPVEEPTPVRQLATMPAPVVPAPEPTPMVAGAPVEPGPLPVFIEAPQPVPVAAFTPVPHSIRPFPAAEPIAPVEPVAVPVLRPLSEIADVPPMPPLIAEAPEEDPGIQPVGAGVPTQEVAA